MRQCSACFLLSYVVLSGCGLAPDHEYLDTHPEFSPLVPALGKTEYQVVWYRSWQPLIHLRVQVEGKELTENPGMTISYAVSAERIQPLRTVRKPVEKLEGLAEALRDTGFWSDDQPCMELSYREGRTYLPGDGGCEWVTVMDGASMSIAASEPTRSKAISVMCGSIGSCEPYDKFALAILELLGLDMNGQ